VPPVISNARGAFAGRAGRVRPTGMQPFPYLHFQQRTSTCAVASVRSVLHWQFNVRLSESALVALGTTAEEPLVRTGSFTHHLRRMIQGASRGYNTSSKPWRLRVRAQGTWNDLALWANQGRLPIVQVHTEGSDTEAHAVVVLSVEGNQALVFDPAGSWKTQPSYWTRRDFEHWWYVEHLKQRWFAVVTGGRLQLR
jgi:hypothetical protein